MDVAPHRDLARAGDRVMRNPSVRPAIVGLGLATALIHLSLNLPPFAGPGLLFTVNGLGYLALVAAFALNPPLVRERSELLRYAFIAYALLTIVGWIVMGERSALAYVDKALEVALILALWRDGRSRPRARTLLEGST